MFQIVCTLLSHKVGISFFFYCWICWSYSPFCYPRIQCCSLWVSCEYTMGFDGRNWLLISLFISSSIRKIRKINSKNKVLITDVIWAIPTFILGIVSAVRESQYSSLGQNYQSLANKGAFASASVSIFKNSFSLTFI